MTYSLDFRKKLLDVRKREALTIQEVAARFSVGKASVMRWLRRLEPQRTRNKPTTKIDMEARTFWRIRMLTHMNGQNALGSAKTEFGMRSDAWV